jgi:hypothetical protein
MKQEFLPAVDVYRQTQQDKVKLQETLRDRIVTDGNACASKHCGWPRG